MAYKKVLFRSDSSSQIGLGHLMRDLVLAQEFNNAQITFASQELEGSANSQIIDANYKLLTLQTDSIDEFIKVIKTESSDLVVIDNYAITYEDEKRIKASTSATLFVLDDTYEKHYCDILLNHNISADASRYKELVPSHCELRCGSDFTLIRNEFKEAKKQKNLFIAMGGSDSANSNSKIVSALKELSFFHYLHLHIVTTSANAYLQELQELTKKLNNVTLHINATNIAQLMKRSDFAIVTPSVTLNEVHYMNLRALVIQTATNQEDMFNFAKNNGYKVLKTFEKEQCKQLVQEIYEKS